MAVKRVVANISADDTGSAKAFYGGVLDMTMAMDLGWIVTFVAKAAAAPPQVSIATEGGAGTAVPDISIEVDNLDEVHRRAVAGGFDVEYGPVTEPWGITRFYVRDPFGRLVNILTHLPSD
jgi:catechol 2,3-dioxygenase-like lactoylglutathione lyase family enzyme